MIRLFLLLICVFCVFIRAASPTYGQRYLIPEATRIPPSQAALYQNPYAGAYRSQSVPLNQAPQNFASPSQMFEDVGYAQLSPPSQDFATADPYGPLPYSQPYSDSEDGANGQICDPVGELFRKALGLDQTPDYLAGYYDPFSTQLAYGAAGFTPYQLRWVNQQEIAYTPSAPADGVDGSFRFTELNGKSRYAFRTDEAHVFSWTLLTSSKFLSGPTGVALGPNISRIQSDFQLASNYPSPLNWQIGLTPQMNSDFQRQLTRDAYMLDARAVVFNKVSPTLTLALGLAYWDRNHGHIIPYGGVIWAPDDRWEFRVMFPKSRISYYAGNIDHTDYWFYGSAEYTLDAYQVTLQDNSRMKQRMELQDYRFMLGITAQRPGLGTYLEGGYITDRHVNFRGPTHDFGIGDVWTIRAGVTF